MPSTLCLLPVLLGWGGVLAADEPPAPPPQVEEIGPKEIDFSPLLTLKSGRYKIAVQCEAGVDRYSQVFDIDARTTVLGVRDLVRSSFEAGGWDVKPVGDDKLIINGTKKNGVRKVAVQLDPNGLKGLSKDDTPTVRPVK